MMSGFRNSGKKHQISWFLIHWNATIPEVEVGRSQMATLKEVFDDNFLNKNLQWRQDVHYYSRKIKCQMWESDGDLRGPFPYYRNESFQYLCSDVLRRNGMSLTGKEAIKTFYFSKDSGLKPATERNYFCLPTSLRSHSRQLIIEIIILNTCRSDLMNQSPG